MPLANFAQYVIEEAKEDSLSREDRSANHFGVSCGRPGLMHMQDCGGLHDK